MLAIRITIRYTSEEAVLNYFQNCGSLCLIASENESTNHHYHIVMQTSQTATAVRNRFKTNLNLPVYCNAYYCQKLKTNYHIYSVKNTLQEPLFNNLYSTEEIEEMKKLSYNKPIDGKPTFKMAINLYNRLEDTTNPNQINKHILDYIHEWVKGTLHDENTIQRLGNAIASRYYEVEYRRREYYFV